MGEWSDYFEDFPEENPASDGKSKVGPLGAWDTKHEKSAPLDGNPEIKKLLAEAWNAEKKRSFIGVWPCPQCGFDELYTYQITGLYHLCECQDCGIYGTGGSAAEAIDAATDAIGEGLDWRDNPYPVPLTRRPGE